jgi:hypothetical protein
LKDLWTYCGLVMLGLALGSFLFRHAGSSKHDVNRSKAADAGSISLHDNRQHAVLPAPMVARRNPTPTVATDGDAQEGAFAQWPDEMIEMRTALSWRVWDLYSAALDACGRYADSKILCWFRFSVELTEHEPFNLNVYAGNSLPCSYVDFANQTPHDAGLPSEQLEQVRACIDREMGRIDGVSVPARVRDMVGAYEGPLDVEVLVRPLANVRD